MRLASSPVRSLIGAALGTLLALSSMSAQANFVSNITVQLFAPGGPTLTNNTNSASQTVAVADLATGLSCCTGDVASNMLTGERIFFDGDSIKLRVGVGDDTTGGVYTTGYLGVTGDPARYEFDGLSIAGKTIVGLNIYAWDDYGTVDDGHGSGLANPGVLSSLAHVVNPSTVSFELDTLQIAKRIAGSSNNFAEFRIDLVTQDAGTGPGGGNNVPEPATLALFAIAALGAGAARRRG